MRPRIPSNRSVIYPILEGLCKISEKVSFLGLARRRFGRYLTIEILILASICVGALLLIGLPRLPFWARVIGTLIFAYRVVTMALAHISILLLNTGKSTPGERIHSRLRYLGLSALNFVEILIFGALLMFCFVEPGKASQHYSETFNSWWEIIYYNFIIAVSFGTGRIYPLTPLGYAHHVLISMLGIEIIVVVLAIVLSIPSEDEVVRGDELSEIEYWDWRAHSFDSVEWARDHKLRDHIALKLRGSGVTSVVDVGCGIGQLCVTLAAEGYSVFGVERSHKMIEIARKNSTPSIKYQEGDACQLPFPDKSVDAVIMRMLLHNVLKSWTAALSEARRILNANGKLIVVEGFPPNEESATFFMDVLKQVHTRYFFKERMLLEGIKTAGFNIETNERVIVEKVSVMSWLASAVPKRATQEALLKAHLEMPEICKKAYNLRIDEGDVFIDLSFLVIVATVS